MRNQKGNKRVNKSPRMYERGHCTMCSATQKEKKKVERISKRETCFELKSFSSLALCKNQSPNVFGMQSRRT